MKINYKPSGIRIPNKDLLDDLIGTAKKLKKDTLTKTEYNEYGLFSAMVLLRRFGSWNNALEAARLKTVRHSIVSIERLFKNLKAVWLKLGRQPLLREMKKPLSRISGNNYMKVFRTWNRTLKEFILYNSSNKRKWRKEQRKKAHLYNFPDKGPVRRDKVNPAIRYDILKRDNYKCVICGRSPANNDKVKLEVDHIVPVSKGGKNHIENLRTLCDECNLGKAAKLEGYLV